VPGKKIIQAVTLSFWILISSQFILSQNVKVIHIPDDVKIEENTAREILVHNLSREEIYRSLSLNVIDGFIYLDMEKPVEIIKLNLKGKTVKRAGGRGQGPGEFIWISGIREFKGNIAVLDTKTQKMVIFNKNLELIREFKLTLPFFGFLVDNNNRFIFYGNASSDHYFTVYTQDGKFTNKFAKTLTSRAEYRKILNFDSVRYTLYIPGEDGIWTCFKNRYDIRYYRKTKLSVEIKEKKGFFKGERQNIGGREIVLHLDRAVHLARSNSQLFYFYRLDDNLFCDIFNLSDYQLQRRIRFKMNYKHVAHYRDNIFYALGYDTNDEEDLLLFQLEL
jgi:hypothetical protein